MLMNYDNGFQGDLGKYKVVKTEDNSLTLWSEKFDENCHSLHGARTETQYNYIKQCEVLEKYSAQPQLTIFEVGLGVGTGLIETLKSISPIEGKKLRFISSELDEELISWVIKNSGRNDWKFPQISSLKRNETEGLVYYQTSNELCEIVILAGDVRKTLPQANSLGLVNSVHAIYQDAFSPKSCPILWTTEWFTDLLKVASTSAILSTYSSSSAVRKSMIKAGWTVDQFPGLGKKKHGTLALAQGETPQSIIEKLERSPLPPLTDAAITQTR